MGKSLSRSPTQQRPEIAADELFVPNVIARTDIDPPLLSDVDRVILKALQMMLPDIRQAVRDEGPVVLKLIVACEVYKSPRAPQKKFMG